MRTEADSLDTTTDPYEPDSTHPCLHPLSHYVRLGGRNGAMMEQTKLRDALDFHVDDVEIDLLRVAIEDLESQLAELLDYPDEDFAGGISIEALRELTLEFEELERENPLV